MPLTTCTLSGMVLRGSEDRVVLPTCSSSHRGEKLDVCSLCNSCNITGSVDWWGVYNTGLLVGVFFAKFYAIFNTSLINHSQESNYHAFLDSLQKTASSNESNMGKLNIRLKTPWILSMQKSLPLPAGLISLSHIFLILHSINKLHWSQWWLIDVVSKEGRLQ